MSLEDIRAKNKDGNLDRFLKAAGKTSMGKKTYNNEQEVTYYPERDKGGNGSAIIRFLPGLESEDYPYYIERFQHGFKLNNKWYIEFCPTTPVIGRNCPVCDDGWDIIGEYGSWDDCPEDIQKMLRPRGRTNGYNAGYYGNILVIKDPVNPENEGKVHLFKFGKGIMNFIMAKIQPKDDGLGTTPKGVDIFDLDVGMNFKFIIHKKDGRADYLSSEWEKASKCPDFDLDTQNPLKPLVDEKLFKSDEELLKRYNEVYRSSKRLIANAESVVDETPQTGTKIAEVSKPDNTASAFGADTQIASDEDNMAYFQDIADEVNI